ncbi:hypothetical protein PVAP13_3NG050375 [Panicum virgatum]|uniref:RING-type domain-containing protein n=1 Tax=Panicum virgatum TaxID=38727 RepID=A0A8T0U6A1_PANVG|nr:hypothetical protein PVAP13_3NG050375 [Panicum virgatum]
MLCSPLCTSTTTMSTKIRWPRPAIAAAASVLGPARPPCRLQSLPVVTAGRSREGEDCAVCLQSFCADEKPCSHAFQFHQDCISEWLRRNAVCPLCRHQLPPAEEDGNADEQVAS